MLCVKRQMTGDLTTILSLQMLRDSGEGEGDGLCLSTQEQKDLAQSMISQGQPSPLIP